MNYKFKKPHKTTRIKKVEHVIHLVLPRQMIFDKEKKMIIVVTWDIKEKKRSNKM